MTREMASPVSRWTSPEPGLSLTGKPDHLLCSLPEPPLLSSLLSFLSRGGLNLTPLVARWDIRKDAVAPPTESFTPGRWSRRVLLSACRVCTLQVTLSACSPLPAAVLQARITAIQWVVLPHAHPDSKTMYSGNSLTCPFMGLFLHCWPLLTHHILTWDQ